MNPTKTELQAQINALNEEAAKQVRDPKFRDEQAAIMDEDIFESFQNNNLVSILTNTKYVGLTEEITFRATRGLKARHVARGGYIEESVLTRDIDYIKRDQIGFHVVEHIQRLATGFYATADEIIRLGAQRIDAEVNRRVFKTFEAAVPPSAPNYFGVSGLTLSNLDAAIAYVDDQPVTSQGPLNGPVIVARAGMVAKIKEAITQNNAFGAFLPETNEDLLRRGVVTNYQGVPIVKLQNFLDENDLPFFPGNELWVVGQDVAQTGFYGQPINHNYQELGTEYWHYITRFDYGVAVIHPERLARVVDSTVRP